MYAKGLKSGKDYSKLEKSIAILFIDFNLKKLERINKYLTKWNIREENYTDLILTDDLELYIISLPKYKEQKNKKQSELDLWLEFIEKPEVILKMKNTNKEIQKA